MPSRALRLLVICGLAGLVAWWARLRAHSKLPPAEGRWREIAHEDLG